MSHPLSAEIEATRYNLALQLDTLSGADRIDAAHVAVNELNGTYIPANDTPGWGAHYAEISLLGISHQGVGMEEAIQHWIKAVFRVHFAEGQAA